MPQPDVVNSYERLLSHDLDLEICPTLLKYSKHHLYNSDYPKYPIVSTVDIQKRDEQLHRPNNCDFLRESNESIDSNNILSNCLTFDQLNDDNTLNREIRLMNISKINRSNKHFERTIRHTRIICSQ